MMRIETVFGGLILKTAALAVRSGIPLVAFAIPFLLGTSEAGDGKADLFCQVSPPRFEWGEKADSTVTVAHQDGTGIRVFRTTPIKMLRRSDDGKLLATMQDGSVEEFDLFGKRLWRLPESPVKTEEGRIVYADPLPEGRVLLTVAMRLSAGGASRVIEVDREGRVLRTLEMPERLRVRAIGETRLQIFPGKGPPFETGWDGKDRRAIGENRSFAMLALPDGHVITVSGVSGRGSIVELDLDGKVVWTAPEQGENTQPHLLANGNILAAST